jgi:putative cardiolipin synthase
MYYLRVIALVTFFLLLFACAGEPVYQCPPGTQNLPDCPPANAVNDESINRLYASRTWQPANKLNIDPIEMGKEAKVPINMARTKVLGPKHDEAMKSLAVKLWLIEHAEHTVDVMYYIFKRDRVGYAVLGELCNAVQRGVDVRIMVDSLGSMHPSHDELRALETCDEEAGFMRNKKGELTTKKARVQVVIFNPISRLEFNRRSHDKLLIVDGHHPEKAAVITGGRNISLDYYGIKEDGSQDPTAFRDLEILIRARQAAEPEEITIGSVTEIYYTLLFLHKGNKRIYPIEDDSEDYDKYRDLYLKERQKSQQSLAFLKNLPDLKKDFEAMPRYMSKGFRNSEVRLAHQLSNLTSKKVTTEVIENVESNPNSILYLINKLTEKALQEGVTSGTLRIVSPYLFTGLYRNDEGDVVYDGAKEINQTLHDHPGLKIEIITNSVMTSDNFFTQAIIDMDMAPRVLLTPELTKAWQSSLEKGEFNPEVTGSEEWKKQINNPQIYIYQTGKLDSVEIGKGTTYYGKLHAKFILGESIGFIGTSNFDYRSNLYNNEMGFFFRDPGLRNDLLEIFEWFKATSYRWGTPEWLQMRKELMASKSKKAGPARKQRIWFKTTRDLGLEYLM